jgi:hypothetical protein
VTTTKNFDQLRKRLEREVGSLRNFVLKFDKIFGLLKRLVDSAPLSRHSGAATAEPGIQIRAGRKLAMRLIALFTNLDSGFGSAAPE